MKIFLAFCLINSLAAGTLSKNTTWGERVPKDELIHLKNVFDYPVPQGSIYTSVRYPNHGEEYYNITYIEVQDEYRNSSGADAILKSGGPGNKFATIGLRSQPYSGIMSTVIMYGIKLWN